MALGHGRHDKALIGRGGPGPRILRDIVAALLPTADVRYALRVHPALEVAANEAQVTADLDVRQATPADRLVDPAGPDREEVSSGSGIEQRLLEMRRALRWRVDPHVLLKGRNA